MLDQTVEKKYKILIVDDEEMLNNMYEFKFQQEWFEVEVAKDWIEAYASIHGFQPDVVLLDIMMPNMDGFETLKLFKQEPFLNSKVIVLSNLSDPKYIQLAKEMWADDFMVKANSKPQDIVDKVKVLLNEKN